MFVPWLMLAVASWCAGADDPPEPPTGQPPQFCLGRAFPQDLDVGILLSTVAYRQHLTPDGQQAMRWKALRPVTLGISARVFTGDGRELPRKEVLQRLSQPACVVALLRGGVRRRPQDLKPPDEFYLATLAADAVVVVVAAEDVLPLVP